MGRRADPDLAPDQLDEQACFDALAELRRAIARIEAALRRADATGSADKDWRGRAEAAYRHKMRGLSAVQARLLTLLLAKAGKDPARRFVAAATARLDPGTLADVWEAAR